MRIINLYILVFFSISSLFAETGNTPAIWIDGNSYQSYLHDQKSEVTLYFSSWKDEAKVYLNRKNYRISLKLTDAFDPLPSDETLLPDLKTLASLNNPELLDQYFEFLESYSRTKGYSHLVLPDTLGHSLFEKEVIERANLRSPLFFLNSHSVSYKVPKSKKEFIASSNDRIAWVTSSNTNTRKLTKWLKKSPRSKANVFFQKLKNNKRSFINTPQADQDLNQKILRQAIAAIDPLQQLPIRSDSIVYLGNDPELLSWLSRYAYVSQRRIPGLPVINDQRDNLKDHQNRDIVLVRNNQPDYDFSTTTLLMPPQQLEEHILMPQMLFGAKPVLGRYPVAGSRTLPSLDLVGYSSPIYEKMDGQHLKIVDSLAVDAIRKMATPGCQVAVIKNGSIILEKSYGYLTYDSLQKVTKNTLYDVASLTKVTATLPAIALLIDQGKVSLDDSIGLHLPSFRGSNKSEITIRRLLAHHSGIKAYIPFWKRAMDGDRLDVFYYKNAEDEANDVRTYGMEPSPELADTLKSWIVASDLIKDPNRYHYSDIGFIILHLIVEKVSGMSFERFVVTHFYVPMDLRCTFFNPAEKGISYRSIAPTEYDNRYRNEQVWGEVHDRNAHIFGGAAGHAGLFANATDLARIMYMYLNRGHYGGWQYLNAGTTTLFNKRHFEHNRRGLGWDKKGPDYDTPSMLASDQSFGHTGFTGTMVWADPEKDLVFVFLSNRLYPDAENWKLSHLNTRTQMHEIIYQSILFH